MMAPCRGYRAARRGARYRFFCLLPRSSCVTGDISRRGAIALFALSVAAYVIASLLGFYGLDLPAGAIPIGLASMGNAAAFWLARRCIFL